MTATIPETKQQAGVRFEIPGWQRPAWATSVNYDENHAEVVFTHPLGMDITLSRADKVIVDGEAGTVSIQPGETFVDLDTDELTVAEACLLVGALTEVLPLIEDEVSR